MEVFWVQLFDYSLTVSLSTVLPSVTGFWISFVTCGDAGELETVTFSNALTISSFGNRAGAEAGVEGWLETGIEYEVVGLISPSLYVVPAVVENTKKFGYATG